MKLTEQQAEYLFREEKISLVEGELELVEEGDWEDGGKYSHLNNVYKDAGTGKHYQSSVSRTGSYYSDYDYYYETDLPEVVAVEVTTKVWRCV